MTDNNPDGGVAVDLFVLDDKLAKIRTQINSKLENQKHLAIILSAVEENIEEQNNEKTPVAYFVSFLSLLDQCIRDDEIVDGTLAATTAYFLDIVFPFTPKALLKSKFGDILAKLAPPLTLPEAEAPLVRSTIGALESLLLAQDHQQWVASGNISPKRALLGLLELSFDPRPKVRRRAQEAVHNILTHPPASPSPTHVAAPVAGDVSLNKLTSLLQESKKHQKNSNKEINSQIIHCLQLITSITSANAWPANKIERLCDILLEISKTSDQYLVSSAFSAFEGLFKSMNNIIDVEKFTNILDIIFDLKPSINDAHLAASWLAVVAKALESFATLSPEVCLEKLPSIIPVVSHFLSSDSKDIYESSSQCLIAIVSETIPDNFLLQPSATNGITGEIYEKVDDVITFISEHIEHELLSVKYQHAVKEILELITAIILKLRTRVNPDFLGILGIVGEWRTNEKDSFPFNKEAEDVISAAISTIGPQVVLSVLPLNLTGGDQPGRAWLLPLLRDNVRFAELNFFKSSIFPAVEFFENKIAEASNKQSMHIKIFQTIVDQIWSLLPHFCDLPKDLTSAFDDAFAAQLSDLMYSRVELRTPICHALRLLVESNVACRDGALESDLLIQEELPIKQANENLDYLAAKASNILSVLFNVFSSTLPDSRGFVLETIDTYLQIVPKGDLEETFNKVCGLLKNAMDEEAHAAQPQGKKSETPKLSITMLDLIVAMSKYVPESSHNALFSIFSATVPLQNNALMQKRSYRIISKLAETDEGKQSLLKFIGEIENVLIENTETTHSSARASRLNAILLVLELLPQSDLFFIPSIVQEIILSTKDVNERTRELSYQILIKMGHKMAEGGVVENGRVPGFDAETPSSEASLTEFFTMVSAGLAAQAPHMISATITAISCLVFEFKDKLPIDMLLEIASTVELFLTHNSREIAKSAIGFVKVEVLSLPEEMVRANLSELLTKLMRWSHEHKGHFKSKVKHILERLIRKFGVEVVEEAIPEDDKKLVANIKKTRNRAKRKQDAEEAETSAAGPEKKFVSAYEEALYDSDVSDDEMEEDEVDDNSSRNKKKANQYILKTGDEPLNLLDRQSLAHISSSKPKKFSKASVNKSDFKTKNGKFVFNENDEEEDPLAGKGSGVDAYLDAVKQAPVRGQRNKLKFKKNKSNDDNFSDDEEPERPSKASSRDRVLGKNKISKPKKPLKSRKKL
ncbi:pre-rRNA processing protein [Scheffersomyces stipitis CBS 6054]|uniref:Pre-rRNA processing protein n=1 Tax=Scheffersomyces stipitis (strain ATCC 58785 / CBS 6054 / NBRC 10063 / NRRL Y-11545) TaxID=322104 RepID=A3LWG2_PICST|nr:pre-rRNA processing protein [Scheffersomyces stipitis CBS 6054]ABN67271.1 pre-rRNA processing protein [Scheffersomyces stipitis CBS 6054]